MGKLQKTLCLCLHKTSFQNQQFKKIHLYNKTVSKSLKNINMSRRNEDFDEFCDPENPRILKYEDVVAAAKSIKPLIIHTPCMAAHTQRELGIYVHYKLEFMQRTGSFKERGTLYALQRLPTDKKKIGVIVAATGNDATGLCYHTGRLNIPATVVFPVTIPISKLHKCTSFGAKTVLHGNNLTEAMKHARSLAKERGLTYINIRDHPHVLNGYGTVALEVVEQAPFADAIIVPLGTGGLAAAVATVVKHRKPSCLVYGVEAENLPLITKSLDSGEPLSNTPLKGSLAGNALSVNCVGVNAFENLKSLLDKVLLVKEEWIARAMLHLVEREKFIVEGSGACPLAAIIGNLVPELKMKNVVCLLTGGNIDSIMLNRSLQIGLAAEGRLVKFKVGIYNQPGAKTNVMQLIASGGYNVITHFVDNFWTEGDTYRAEIKLVVETKNLEHALELKRIVEKAYPLSATFESEPFNDKRTCPCYAKKNA